MSKSVPIIGCFSLLLAIMLSFLNLQHGNLNQDEGWYLYAAKLVSEGQTPYADFAYAQGPVLPYVYGSLYGVVAHWGLAGARFMTSLFGLLSAVLAGGLVFRLSDRNKGAGAVVAFLLVGCNVYQSYFTTVVKTYALCSLLLMAGFFALSFRKHHRWGGLACLLSGALLALAAGTRLSAGIVLPIVGIWLIVRSFTEGARREDFGSVGGFLGQRFNWIFFGIGGGAALLAIFVPFFLTCPDEIFFDILGYHAGRDGGTIAQKLVLKAGFVSRFVQAYVLFAILSLSVFILSDRGIVRSGPEALLLWICGIAISLLHFMMAIPYDDYQTIVFPVLGGALALSLIGSIDPARVQRALLFILLASVACAFSSSINEAWFVRGRDRIWSQFKEKSDLAQLQEAAEFVRQNSPEDSLLLTQDTYLAIEANRSVPLGMEMGAFCYYPEMPREQAEKYKFINREMLFELLDETQAPLAAFSGYGFTIGMPAIEELPQADTQAFLDAVAARYEPVAEFQHFGQGHTSMKLFKLKEVE